MDCSFNKFAERQWFVFDTTTGQTLKANLISKSEAILWMQNKLLAAKAKPE